MTISQSWRLKRNMKKMKKTAVVLLTLAISLSSWAQAELTKQEKKALVVKAKAFKKNPSLLNQLYIDKAASDEKVAVSEMKLNSIEQQLEEMRSEIELTKEKNDLLERQIATLTSQKGAKESKPKSLDAMKGVVFRVQIGGFKKRNLLEYNEDDNLIRVETNANGVQEISLGVFRNYKKADVFKKHLREMGLNEAWIVPYKDGKRVALKEVYDEAISSSQDK